MTDRIRDRFDAIVTAYDAVNERLSGAGGIGELLSAVDRVKRDLDEVSEEQLERMEGEIKHVVESLLKVDYELRKVQNLKALFEQGGESQDTE